MEYFLPSSSTSSSALHFVPLVVVVVVVLLPSSLLRILESRTELVTDFLAPKTPKPRELKVEINSSRKSLE